MYQEWFERYKKIISSDTSQSDRTFREIGYKGAVTSVGILEYYKDANNMFILNDKGFYKTGDFKNTYNMITKEELIAIYKLYEELGWLDE